ncbi:phosphoglycerate kinase [Alkalicaulis satelles]|uniref:Phosphoglycerate kinase n=1 Tax=Alkalicaulis satelles TaxID=2609175 RepID=A0A5M6ZMA5_9PROT|nr:phosphoglycerate kinase [Alkalicaulis satelles]KAA5803411.1 phosphoglycerate kinase [Alkalicaulis satelles]
MIRRIEDADIAGKRVLVRVDFNVPMEHGRISDDTRLRAALPTIQYLREGGAKVILAAHFDRPRGQRVPSMSLAPVASALEDLIGAPVKFVSDCIGPDAEGAVQLLQPGGVLLLENTRFHAGEEANDPEFAAQLAKLADLYVNDAFSAAHRAHASTERLARLIPSYAGLALQSEIDHVTAALEAPQRPLLAIVGGAKVSTKIALLKTLATKVDRLFIGGAMANTFLAARGHSIGSSLYERDLLDTARAIEDAARSANCDLMLPVDVVVAREFKAHADRRVAELDDVQGPEMILDCGPETVDRLADALAASRTLVWNGPLGAFETPPFDTATIEAAQFAAKRCREHGLTAVAGGGDTVSALNRAGVAGDFTFVSTAGGAFLEWLEGKTLPGIAVLQG